MSPKLRSPLKKCVIKVTRYSIKISSPLKLVDFYNEVKLISEADYQLVQLLTLNYLSKPYSVQGGGVVSCRGLVL